MITLAPASSARRSHLAFALLSLPATRRRDALVFFRFCRAVDDIADEGSAKAPEREAALEEWLEAVAARRLPPELEDVVARHEIPRDLLSEIIRGCLMDVRPCGFETLPDLERYCWRVACAVGLASIRIFGCTRPASESYAEHLGHALQLTNILRDVGEDAGLGRIYLPADLMAQFGVSREEIFSGRPGPGFLPLVRFLAGRARSHFDAAVPPAGDHRALLAAETMKALYAKILDRLDAAAFPVFERRIRLGRLEKVLVALRVCWQGHFSSELRPTGKL